MFFKHFVIDLMRHSNIWSSQVVPTKLKMCFYIFTITNVWVFFRFELNFIARNNCRPSGRQKLLSACVSMWMESHKICKVWVFINQILSWCFHSCGLWLNKSNHRVKQAGISKSTNINQSISISGFYPIHMLIFIWGFFCFSIIHHNSIFMWEEFVIQLIEKSDICIVVYWNC